MDSLSLFNVDLYQQTHNFTHFLPLFDRMDIAYFFKLIFPSLVALKLKINARIQLHMEMALMVLTKIVVGIKIIDDFIETKFHSLRCGNSIINRRLYKNNVSETY